MTPAEKMIEEIPEKTTIQNVLKKENELLAFRWKVAGCEKELPSLELVTERLNKILYDFSERKGYRIKRAVALQRKMDGLPETNADLWVLSAIQVVQGTAEENNNMAIRIVTKIGEDSESTLMLLSLITQNVNEKTYIRSILATNPKATLEQLFWDACRIHDNIGDSVQDRWMRQKYEFRTKNPICPQCGATLEKRYKRDGQEDYYCNSCYWTPHTKDFTPCGGADTFSSFRKEIAYIKKVKTFTARETTQFESIQVAITNLETLYKRCDKDRCHPDSKRIEQLLKDLKSFIS